MQTDGHTQTDRQTHAGRHTDRQTSRQAGSQTTRRSSCSCRSVPFLFFRRCKQTNVHHFFQSAPSSHPPPSKRHRKMCTAFHSSRQADSVLHDTSYIHFVCTYCTCLNIVLGCCIEATSVCKDAIYIGNLFFLWACQGSRPCFRLWYQVQSYEGIIFLTKTYEFDFNYSMLFFLTKRNHVNVVDIFFSGKNVCFYCRYVRTRYFRTRTPS